MQPASPELLPYQQLLDTLLRCDNSQQVAEHVAAADHLLDRTLLHTLAACPVPDEPTAREQQWLQQVLAQLLSRKRLAEYLHCPESEAFAYAVAHPELLTEENYAHLQGLIDQAGSAPTNGSLLSQQVKLAQTAAEVLTFRQEWLTSHFIPLPTQSWLTHPAAQAYFTWVAEQQPEVASRVATLIRAIASAVEEEKELSAEQEKQLDRLLDELNEVEGNNRIPLLHAALPLAQENYPVLWAQMEIWLGNALSVSFLNNRAQNLEDAITAYQLALRVYTREHYMEQWAGTQNNLGNAYRNRLHGERAQNLEDAITAYQLAAEVYTNEQHKELRAMTQNNLGNAYRDRLRRERAQNLEDAVAAYQLALQVYARERNKYKEQWAITQNNLGVTYRARLEGNQVQNSADAIAAHKLALQVYTRDDYEEEWAMTQNNLGNAYHNRSGGKRRQNIEDAIIAYQLALQVRTREKHKEQWAGTQNNLGNAYHNRLCGRRAQNLKDAIAAYQLALQVFTREQYPQNCQETNWNLGNLLYDEKRYVEARAAYEEAHQALTLIRAETVREESRRQLAQDNAQFYARLIHCCLVLNDPEAAATYVLSGKSRSLSELLAGTSQALDQLVQQNATLKTEWESVQQLKVELNTLLAVLERPAGKDDTTSLEERQATDAASRNRIGPLRLAINQQIDTLLFHYPALAAVQPLPPLSPGQAQALAGELGGVPLVEYVRHAGGWGAFVVLPTATHYVPLAADLADRLNGDVEAILNDTFWNPGLSAQTAALTRLYAWLIAPLRGYLPPAGALVLAPTQQLHLVPFQALLSAQGSYLGQDYALSFVPSLATLRVLHEQQRQSPRTEAQAAHRLLSVACSGEGLRFLANVLREAAAVRDRFADFLELLEADALPERVYEAAHQPFGVVHINCHGSFDAHSPVDSHLRLGLGTQLSVNDIRLRLRLRGRPLVALSACQTGQTRPEQGDEANGLSWAFLAAGAAAVISSQWSVNDDATRELFKAFYQQRQQARVSEAEALRRAVVQLRQKRAYERWPRYWAAFQVMGLPVPVE